MERLTYKNARGEWCVKNNTQCAIASCSNENGKYYIGEPINRLAELEDKLEYGIPFEPLCKVGDTVYQILKSLTTPDLSIEPLTIVSAKFYEDTILYICKDSWQLTSYVESTQLNDRWFLIREEAEKRLEELKK